MSKFLISQTITSLVSSPNYLRI